MLHVKTLGLGLLAALFAVTAAFAHTGIKASNIKNGATLDAVPPAFTFEFGQAVGLAAIDLHTAAGAKVALDYKPPKAMAKSFSIPLPRLAPGAYIIKWRAVAKDGHPMSGEIRFSVSV